MLPRSSSSLAPLLQPCPRIKSHRQGHTWVRAAGSNPRTPLAAGFDAASSRSPICSRPAVSLSQRAKGAACSLQSIEPCPAHPLGHSRLCCPHRPRSRADGCRDRALPSRLAGRPAAKLAVAAAAAAAAALRSSLESGFRAARRCQRSARGRGVDALGQLSGHGEIAGAREDGAKTTDSRSAFSTRGPGSPPGAALRGPLIG